MTTKHSISFITTAVLLLLTLLSGALFASKVVQAQTGDPDDSTAGRLYFKDGETAPTGDFVLELGQFGPPPTDHHYELWLSSETTETFRLGSFVVEDGDINLVGSTERNLLANFDTALISIEPDDDTDFTISTQIVCSVTLSETILTPVRQLLAPPEGEDGEGKGVLFGAKEQVTTAIRHGGFMREALAEGDLPEARRHAEHVVNILDGENGFVFGDIDRDGRAQNPGDGFGLRIYIDETLTEIMALQESMNSPTATVESEEQIAVAIEALESSQSLVSNAMNKALQLFAADTADEGQQFAEDLKKILEQLGVQIGTAHDASLQVVAYRFDKKEFESLELIPTLVPTATPLSTKEVTATVTATKPVPTLAPTKAPTRRPTATSRGTRPGDRRPDDRAPRPQPSTSTATPTKVTSPTATPSATATPSPTIEGPTLQSDPGKTWTDPDDGTIFVFVPGGEFTMGATEQDALSSNEHPDHTVTVVDGFWLQQTETTNTQYTRCVNDGACTAPNNDHWKDAQYTDHPVTDVSWHQANAYAVWAGGRLPTEAEWERACRGTDDRLYPWGDGVPNATLGNYNNDIGDTTPVGTYPAGASPYGLLDMSGNVWEWTSTLQQDYPYDTTDGREDAEAEGKRAVRGGSFFYTQYQLRCATRTGFVSDTASLHIGFRIVLSSPRTVWTDPTDGTTYLFVSGGEFTMGSTEEEALSSNERLDHAVTVDGFWLQRTETTNAQYTRCVNDGTCTVPNNDKWKKADYADHPVTDVDWQQANAYAIWSGSRLPTEAEWERACRGSDARIYPWGDSQPDATLSNYNNDVGDTSPVGIYPAGASPYGLLDMGGNVWEWTSTVQQSYPYDATDGREDAEAEGKRTVRGGSFFYTQYQLRCATRTGTATDTAHPDIGFRVVFVGRK